MNTRRKIIALEMPNWLVVVNADCCSTNVSAGENLSKLYVLLSPTIRCVCHSAEDSVK